MDNAQIVELHPVTELFRLMSDEEYCQLYQDIREHGLLEKIHIWTDPETEQAYVCDGRHRYMTLSGIHNDGRELTVKQLRDLQAAKLVPSSVRTTAQVLDYVWSLNRVRRQLTTEDIAQAYAAFRKADPERWEPKRGRPGKVPRGTLTAREKAKRLGTSERTVKRLDKASASALRSGTLPEGTTEELWIPLHDPRRLEAH